ncbi:RNA-directed DNA polymerase-like [Vitis vinifera]|uniref:RNA-directed DNA polymerase-like n=1 Tax=Vitis vinifera TaxID=29760 RepID=A0A438FJJ0_VITVI|nr:RNA-directed DNA polymerase-like [Vitis vinifera]
MSQLSGNFRRNSTTLCKKAAKSFRNKRVISQRCAKFFLQLGVIGLQWLFLFASPPYIPDLLMEKDFKASVLHVSELSIAFPWIPDNSPQSRIALALVDNDATHNFVATREASMLGLKLEKDTSRIKAVNSKAQKIQGVAKNVPCKWVTGRLKKGLKKGQETYVAALIEIKEGQFVEVPDSVVKILKEFKDVMPAELPKELPPWGPIDHKIELLLGTKAPTQAPYRMPPIELLEFRKQLKKLLDVGLIQPSRVAYGALVLFQNKHDGSLCMCVDYRALNKVTIKNKYSIPLAAELFDRLSKASYFTKLDLRSGYWQVRIAAGDEGRPLV